MLINYYYILGISHTATTEDIKKAFRLKAKLLHPDINRSIDAKASFQVLNEAYQMLVDSEKRRTYDYKWKSSYGYSFLNRKQSTYKTQNSYYKAYTNPGYYKKKEQDEKIEKTAVDTILFYSLILVGAVSVVMGIFRLIYDEWEGIDNLSGLLMGVWMLFLLLYGWNYIVKETK